MDTSQVFTSKFLKAEDLKNAPRKVTIARVEFEEVGQDKDKKLVIYFEGKEKGFVLNKTNYERIVDIIGSKDSDAWIDREIQLRPERVDNQGKPVDSIRVDLNFGRKNTSSREPGDEDEAPF